MLPHQRVTAHSHTMPRREIDDLIAVRKIVRVGFRMHYLLPLESAFGLHHIEFARQRWRHMPLRKVESVLPLSR
jgi:hypothetical protein